MVKPISRRSLLGVGFTRLSSHFGRQRKKSKIKACAIFEEMSVLSVRDFLRKSRVTQILDFLRSRQAMVGGHT